MYAERENMEVEQVSVAEATATAVDHVRRICEDKNIEIETDLDGVSVLASSALIIPAIGNLLSNGIAAMPLGGELSVTLVETNSQWELEVADSGPKPCRFKPIEPLATQELAARVDEDDDELPTVLEFEAHRTLLVVDRLAREHNGTVQTYSCPLGGTAHVLIIPKFAAQSKPNQYRRAG